MVQNLRQQARKPIEPAELDAMALAYVARYATTRAKLVRYLQRKLCERGWAGATAANPAAIAEHLAERGFVDDESFARAKAAALAGRGHGERRIKAALGAAGVPQDLAAEASALDADAAELAAETYARKRRFGRYGRSVPDEDSRRRQLAAMVRAGHDHHVARRVLAADQG